jgi:hypothetical protein
MPRRSDNVHATGSQIAHEHGLVRHQAPARPDFHDATARSCRA